MNQTKKDIRTAVERILAVAVPGAKKSTIIDTQKYVKAIRQIEETYSIRILSSSLTVDQLVDICYNAGRNKALLSIKRLIAQYDISMKELYPDEYPSIH